MGARRTESHDPQSVGRLRRIRIASALLILVGCSTSDKPTAPPPPAPPPSSHVGYPIHQAEPAWSSRGLIAYVDWGVVEIFRGGPYVMDPSLSGLWILDPSTGAKHRVLPLGESPAWSPDGRTLAFEWNGQIGRVGADGSNLRELTFSGANFHPCWHPDGHDITFDRYPSSWADGAHVYSISAEGGTPRLLCDTPFGDRRTPDWHPDGRRLAVAWNRGASSYYRFQIYVVDTASCAAYRVGYETQATNYHPRFSPDGNQVVFSRQDAIHPGPPNLWVIDRSGNTRQLTTAGADEPAWSPDGKWVAFRNDEWEYSPREKVLWMVNVDDGLLVQLTEQWVIPCVDSVHLACRKDSTGGSAGSGIGASRSGGAPWASPTRGRLIGDSPKADISQRRP